mmetsp:Transcript_115155/g.200443  ORF Transcript_115155/g.200443 Transcript_115155/m.200443 type:complete len:111 (-) Transcript_115155:345-677(-)
MVLTSVKMVNYLSLSNVESPQQTEDVWKAFLTPISLPHIVTLSTKIWGKRSQSVNVCAPGNRGRSLVYMTVLLKRSIMQLPHVRFYHLLLTSMISASQLKIRVYVQVTLQ